MWGLWGGGFGILLLQAMSARGGGTEWPALGDPPAAAQVRHCSLARCSRYALGISVRTLARVILQILVY